METALLQNLRLSMVMGLYHRHLTPSLLSNMEILAQGNIDDFFAHFVFLNPRLMTCHVQIFINQ